MSPWSRTERIARATYQSHLSCPQAGSRYEGRKCTCVLLRVCVRVCAWANPYTPQSTHCSRLYELSPAGVRMQQPPIRMKEGNACMCFYVCACACVCTCVRGRVPILLNLRIIVRRYELNPADVRMQQQPPHRQVQETQVKLRVKIQPFFESSTRDMKSPLPDNQG